jgi:hypothetical protein
MTTSVMARALGSPGESLPGKAVGGPDASGRRPSEMLESCGPKVRESMRSPEGRERERDAPLAASLKLRW